MSRRAPFTIIELLTVIVIISILAALALGVGKYAIRKAHESKTTAKLAAFEDAVEQFKQDRGFFPTTTGIIQLGDYSKFSSYTKLASLTGHPFLSGSFVNSQTGTPYLTGYKGGKYEDGWGHPFLYRCDGSQYNKQTFDIWSAGADGKVGTDDDITNWKRN